MPIIFDEIKYCEKLLRDGVPRIKLNDLKYLSVYWEYQGYKKKDIQKNIEDFCKKNYKYFNVTKSRRLIRMAVNWRNLRKIRTTIPIDISKKELEIIRSLHNYNEEKILFIMLLSARYFRLNPNWKTIKYDKYGDYLYSNLSIKDIFETANVTYSSWTWKKIKQNFTVLGLITPTIQGIRRWAMMFDICSKDEPCITVSDYVNPIAYYQEYCGETIVRCSMCGKMIIKTKWNHETCNMCAKEKRKEFFRMRRNKICNNLISA